MLTASLQELLVLGQCGGSLAELIYTERLIVELLGPDVMEAAASCSPLSFLRMFYDILLVGNGDAGRLSALDLSLLVSRLEVIVCQFDFTRFHVSRRLKIGSRVVECQNCRVEVMGSSLTHCIVECGLVLLRGAT